jgi:hypothetical protein
MPNVKLEIAYTRIVEGAVEVEADVPEDVLDGGDLTEWVEGNISKDVIAIEGSVVYSSVKTEIKGAKIVTGT